ncbi:hypothetical protein HC928_21540, partial [bacterium]|nr:hypothetical protein [bacterium]
MNRLPIHIYGLWVVTGASLALALASLVASMGRPVSALSDVPLRSQVDRLTGILPATPDPRFHADLRIGDR